MGVIEKEALRRRRKGYLQDVVLATIATSGLLAVAVVAPNVIYAASKFGLLPKRFKEQSESALTRLIKKGFVEFRSLKGKKYVEITAKGRAMLERLETISAHTAPRKRWDHRWRLVAFDIPEKLKSSRDRMRHLMAFYGFYRLQDSVWVYPYDCEEVVALIRTDLGVSKNVIYAIVENLENDASVREHFQLR